MDHIPQVDKAISRKMHKAGGITLPLFNLYYEALAISQYGIDQWNRIESPEINPCMCGQLIYNKGAKNIHGEITVSSTNDVGEIGPLCHTHTCDNIQLNAKVCAKHGKHNIVSEERPLQSQDL